VALRSRVLAAVAAALPLLLAAGCSGGTAPGEATAAHARPGGIPAGPAPGPQSLSENYEYAIVSTRQRSAAKARDIKAFLHWVITEGNARQYLGQFRFQPLPASIVSLSDAQIAKIG
jgi:phosphate transport system substrate-binding protein